MILLVSFCGAALGVAGVLAIFVLLGLLLHAARRSHTTKIGGTSYIDILEGRGWRRRSDRTGG